MPSEYFPLDSVRGNCHGAGVMMAWSILQHGARKHALPALGAACLLWSGAAEVWAGPKNGPSELPPPSATGLFEYQADCLAAAIHDLQETHGAKYPGASAYLERLARLRQEAKGRAATEAVPTNCFAALDGLRREALLANPSLEADQVLVVKRRPQLLKPPKSNNGREWYSAAGGAEIGFPSNHECNSSLKRVGYDNEIAVLSLRNLAAPLQTLYRPEDGGYVGEVDLHFAGDRFLFSRSSAQNWKVYELRTDGTGLRQVTRLPDDVDCYDACYLPNGRIVFGSSAPFQAVPCWHGMKYVSNLYLSEADGSGLRRLCYDQDHDLHPAVLANGQIVFSRWEYTGISHIFLRELMLMNPDGTGQRAIYGSSSWFPNSLYFPRAVPGHPERIVSILSGYHGVHKMGQLVVVDISKGWHEAAGILKRISGQGEPVKPEIRDDLVSRDWPKFLHPYPLNDKQFLVAAWKSPTSSWGIYLADMFDNLVLLREEPGYALLEPVPVRKTPPPPVIPDRVNPSDTNSLVYIHNIYLGPGLAGVPQGTVKNLRVVSYDFGYPGLAGPNLIGCGGPWEVMRILGTVPVEADGSAMFHIPANTPVALQPLDAEGKAVQLMRSWFTGMPGEFVSCVGCHEKPADTASMQAVAALRRTPREITPWRGPARGFDFEREVQPVLDKYCVSCHSEKGEAKPDLRPLAAFPNYRGQLPDRLAQQRMHPQMKQDTQGYVKYTPAYEALIPYLHRVNYEDDVSVLAPGEYHADHSELIQLLRKGHRGVALDAEAWDRLATWIDLNGPCHGRWSEVFPIPDQKHERRMALNQLVNGPAEDREAAINVPRMDSTPIAPRVLPEAKAVVCPNWPMDPATVTAKQNALGQTEMTIDLGHGTALKLVKIPAGEFVMGATNGEPDEYPVTRVTIAQPFWMAATEISNEQFRQFDPGFTCGYFAKRHARDDDKGLPLDNPRQPAVRVSWEQALKFCQWLSARTGMKFSLPTEAQWEWACRAGSAEPFYFGGLDADFSPWANLADQSFSKGHRDNGEQVTGGLEHLLLDGAALSNTKFNDHASVTFDVGRYRPNAWGLYDMHGNAAEWTRSTYRPYPYRDDDGRNALDAAGEKVVRGGAFNDRPARARASFRLAFPSWQRLASVSFRIVRESEREPRVEAHAGNSNGADGSYATYGHHNPR